MRELRARGPVNYNEDALLAARLAEEDKAARRQIAARQATAKQKHKADARETRSRPARDRGERKSYRELSDNDEGFASGSDEEEHDFVTDDDDESEEMPSRRSRRETGRERRAVSYREESDDDVDEDDNGGSESKGDDGLVDGEGTSPTRPTKKAGGKLGDRPVSKKKTKKLRRNAVIDSDVEMDGNNDDDDMAAAAGGGAGGGGRVVQKILQSDAAGGRLLVKFAGLSYRKADWLDAACVEAARPSLVTAFRRKGEQLQIDPQWLVIDRVVAHRPAHSDGDDDEQEQEASSEEEEDEKEIEALLGAQKHDDDGGKGEEEKDEEDDGSEGEERGGRRKKEKKSAEKEEESEVVSARERRRQLSAQYLVRWRGLDACEATWESGAELAAGGEADAAALQHYLSRLAAPWPRRRPLPRHKIPADVTPQFRNGRSLRDYQLVGLRWMVHNYMRGANCILGDEMGLGKTAQSTSVLEYLRAVGHVDGPFLVIAPVSTLGHWQREIRTWTDMEVVVYAGSADDRAAIQAHEMYHDASGGNGRRGGRGGGSSASRPLKFHVLLTSFETALKDRGVLGRISWEAAIIDEAHRLKSQTAATRAVIEELSIGWKLLLTGTPIQNNMAELFSILNLLDSDTYDDLDEFLESYGGRPGSTPTVAQIQALQEVLKPVLLRRMKEDVEDLPEKEEVVVWVELTSEQRSYYKALYANQIGALLGGATNKNLPNMRNLAMELRKLCCHPFLCNGLEQDVRARRLEALAAAGGGGKLDESDLLVRASGKMLLLSKLLPKLRAEGRQVLIFSQFVTMLDILEDWIRLNGWPLERLDGAVGRRDRQQAIDRFSAGDTAQSFVFLISTKAGGVGITLTAADTVILYDSDWNPQNDLQAMARCHRIGQDKDVTVYRLVTRDTYEQQLIATANRKYGLDEAILGFSASGGSSDPEADSKRIAELLKHGAASLLDDGAAGAQGAAQQGEAFASEDIGTILAARTEKRSIGGKAGNTFSVARFAVIEEPLPAAAAAAATGGASGSTGAPTSTTTAAAADGEQFWSALLPEAVAAYRAAANAAPEPLGPRRRRAVNYNEKNRGVGAGDAKDDPDFEADDDDNEGGGGSGGGEGGDGAGADGAGDKGQQVKRGRAKAGEVREPKAKRWIRNDLWRLEDALFGYGLCQPQQLLAAATLGPARSDEEVLAVAEALAAMIAKGAELMAALPPAQQGEGGEGGGEDAAMGDAAAERQQGEGGDKARRQRNAGVPDALVAQLQALPAAAALSPAVASAMLATDYLKRLLKNAREWQKQVEEQTALHAYLQTKAEGLAAPVVPKHHFKHLPLWWNRMHDERLFRATSAAGYVPPMVASGTSGHEKARKTLRDVLTSPDEIFCTLVAPEPEHTVLLAAPAEGEAAATAAAEPAAPAAAVADAAAAAPAAGVADVEMADVAAKPQQQEAAPSQVAAAGSAQPAPSAAAAVPPQLMLAKPTAGPQLLNPKAWAALVTDLSRRLKALRGRALDPYFDLDAVAAAKGGRLPGTKNRPATAPAAAGATPALPSADYFKRLLASNAAPGSAAAAPKPAATPAAAAAAAAAADLKASPPHSDGDKLAGKVQQDDRRRREMHEAAAAAAAAVVATATTAVNQSAPSRVYGAIPMTASAKKPPAAAVDDDDDDDIMEVTVVKVPGAAPVTVSLDDSSDNDSEFESPKKKQKRTADATAAAAAVKAQKPPTAPAAAKQVVAASVGSPRGGGLSETPHNNLGGGGGGSSAPATATGSHLNRIESGTGSSLMVAAATATAQRNNAPDGGAPTAAATAGGSSSSQDMDDFQRPAPSKPKAAAAAAPPAGSKPAATKQMVQTKLSFAARTPLAGATNVPR